MNKQKINQVVCLDLFDTLVTTGPNGPNYREVIFDICRKRGISEEMIASRIYPIVRNSLMSRNLSYTEMVDELISALGIEADESEKEQVARVWAEDNEQAEWMDGAESVLDELRSDLGRRLVLVTNVTGPAWDIIDRKLQVRRRFDSLFLSCDTGISKPDPRVWQYVERSYPRAANYWMVGNNVTDDIAVPFKRGWEVGLVDRDKPLQDVISRVPDTDPEKMKSKSKAIILDVPVTDEEKEELATFGLELLDANDLSAALQDWPGWRILDSQKTMLILPGNGSERVVSYLPDGWMERWPYKLFVDIKRLWIPGSDPRVLGGDIFPPKMYTGIKDAVIVDDAVSSGITARQILDRNKCWLPAADWSLVTWTSQRSANIKGFSRFYSCAEVGEKNRKVPLNSISTLLEDPEIAQSYAERNFEWRAKSFLKLLERMRRRRE